MQVYRGRLHSGEDVAVKVQRPYILETVTVDLFVIRRIFNFIKRFKGIHTDFVALLDEWAMRFFEELDYVHEVGRYLQPCMTLAGMTATCCHHKIWHICCLTMGSQHTQPHWHGRGSQVLCKHDYQQVTHVLQAS